ncbi:MAG: DNA repair protein RecO [Acidobacteria bacterium]|nr:MAG: DNA repair protein RecO [Acidobacteriota bacterium]REK01421.1 MAG: DNA repair protein RecO [Acidobacteriota bacterium]REK14377.1 MAG: DNA repair protein RecO [Acidobacteriota bacterium]REK45092.1 MAG: DNA repair protein RecO [Acidobacteriota bacterium]
MAVVETEGLVLRTYALADADKIVVLLTKDDGLVRGVAKGAKRLKSRFGSSLEPFSVVKVSYFRKEERELVSITGIDLERSFFSVASNPYFLQHFSYAAELLQSFAPPHDPNERLFNMTKVCLETAAYKQEAIPAIVAYFEIWLLKLGGFLPSWEMCSNCGRSPEESESVGLQPDFGIVCKNCTGRGGGQPVSPAQRALFLRAQKASPEKFILFADSLEGELEEVSRVLGRMISRILNREINNSGAKVSASG